MARVDVRAQRRAQILEAAQRLVAEKGWAATTYADLCREAGVSNGVLTYHFKNKEEIRFALFEQELARWRDEFRAGEEGRELTAEDRVRYAVEKTAHTVETRSELYQSYYYYLASSFHQGPEQRDRIRTFFREILDSIATELAYGMGLGAIPRRDPYDAASVLLSIVHGYALARVGFGITPPLEDVVQVMFRYLTGCDETAAPDALATTAESSPATRS
jgi:AcrR family transcriptional regulator